MNDVRMPIIAATGTARKRVIPAVRDGGLCTITAIHGRDEAKLAALATSLTPTRCNCVISTVSADIV
ncbi:MAG: hypothetical protein ACLP00_08090 [Terracidiphilus sp.]